MTTRGFCISMVAGALALTASAASAQTQQLGFKIDGDRFVVDVPDGFCLPAGDDADTAKQYASGDTRNVTPVDLQRCGTFEQDYVLVKSPRGLDKVTMAKEDFIAGLAAELEQQFPVNNGGKQGLIDLREETEGDRDVRVVNFGLSGTDDQCAYLGGEVVVTFSDGKTEPVYVGSCGTVVGDRHVFVHSYARVASGASVQSLQARSRALSEAITPR
uniref:hypothetical protein n=1 Tax=uncultured Erythrobacter sp. TaxID=263913 RepID=UPI0026030848|nr:hypothetical protein [uncultured Erythrobacter sp.]